MRREMGPVDRLDPKFVLKVWGAISMMAFVGLVSSRHAQATLEGLLADTNAGAYTNVVTHVFSVLWVASAAIAAVDDPTKRRQLLGMFALVHVLFLLIVVSQRGNTLGHDRLAIYVVVGLAAVTLGLCYAWLMANGDPRPGWNRVIDLFRPRVKTPTQRMRSDYEDRLREAAAQEERNRLARELHDSIKQQVFAIHTAAATAEARLADDPQGTRDAIARVRDSSRDAMLEMEAMLDQMRSGPLTNASLVDGVRKQVEALRLRTGAEVTLEIGERPAEYALPPSLRQAVFRAAQESLNNVAKHARATIVHVTLGVREGEFVLTVADNGAGYEQEAASSGLGLSGMRARATESAGDCSITSKPGAGTTVRFAVPVMAIPTGEIGRQAVIAAAGIVILLMLSLKIGYYPLMMLPLPVLEFVRLSLAWRRARRLTRTSA